ncbi:MAG: ATP-binding protein [Clostridiales bacterium]|jgi:hypothetical protein|nr:ATP-binding protein [Clostridiales bacterium]
MANKKVPLRIAATVMNSLKGGVTPRIGLEYIAVGRSMEIDALLKDIDIVIDGGSSMRFIMGQYGSGKSFLLQTIRNYSMEKGLVVMDCDLSPERRFSGSSKQGLATYKELMANMSVKSKPEGGALPLILEKWISSIQAEVAVENPSLSLKDAKFEEIVSRKVYQIAGQMEGKVKGFDFAIAINKYYHAYNNDDDVMKSKILRWFRGEYNSKSEARTELGINDAPSDLNWFDFINIFSLFMVKAGYTGLLVMVDEIVNIFRIHNKASRENNYEKILNMYNAALQGTCSSLGIFMAGTPESIMDEHKGLFSYPALRSRLSESKFANASLKDLMGPIIKLEPLTHEEMYVLMEKLSEIHADLNNYAVSLTHDDLMYFLNAEYSRVGADTLITPREMIRDFIEILNIIIQNPGTTISQILGSSDFVYADGNDPDGIVDDEFARFEI